MNDSAVELIGQDGALWARVNEFNFAISRRVHGSHLPEAPAAVLAAIQQSPRGARRMSRQLLTGEAGGPAAACFNFRDPAWRLALLDHALLERLVLHIGAAVQARALSRIIDGIRWREVRSAIGDELLTFAVRRALFFHKPPRELQALFPALPEKLTDTTEALQRVGRECIGFCLAGAPREIAQRVELLYPRGSALPVSRPLDSEMRDEVFRFIRRLLVLEMLPDSGAWLS